METISKRETIEEAGEYVDLMLDVRLHRHIHDLMKLCYKLRVIKHNSIPILCYVIDSFLISAEETAERWLTNHCPEWAKPFVDYLPHELLVDILLLNEKDEALKEIQNFLSQTKGVKMLKI